MSPGRRLLDWYDANCRDLPWRGSSDPYAVWVSEIMLQQTRVETARRYFSRFLERFPRLEELAAAPLDDVLAAWSGLGYYRRARQLHAAARSIRERGAFPTSAAELVRLPGVGPYTAAAVASIAFGERVPVLDGNVARVVARFLGEEGAVERSATRGRLLAAAATFLDPRRPGDSNQALMELGATCCLPVAPECGRCPLAGDCVANGRGEQGRFPVRAPRGGSLRVSQLAAVVERGERLLLFRRGDDEAQLAGLWELPLVEARGVGDARRALAERYGGDWRLGPVLGRARHAITRRSFTIVARRAQREDGEGLVREGGGEAGWFERARAGELALTGVTRKLLALLPTAPPNP